MNRKYERTASKLERRKVVEHWKSIKFFYQKSARHNQLNVREQIGRRSRRKRTLFFNRVSQLVHFPGPDVKQIVESRSARAEKMKRLMLLVVNIYKQAIEGKQNFLTVKMAPIFPYKPIWSGDKTKFLAVAHHAAHMWREIWSHRNYVNLWGQWYLEKNKTCCNEPWYRAKQLSMSDYFLMYLTSQIIRSHAFKKTNEHHELQRHVTGIFLSKSQFRPMRVMRVRSTTARQLEKK